MSNYWCLKEHPAHIPIQSNTRLGLLTSVCSVVCLLPQAYSNKFCVAALEAHVFHSFWRLGAQQKGMVIPMGQDVNAASVAKRERISAHEPGTILLGTILALLSAIVCMQILGKVGVSANTSILCAIFAMLVSKIPVKSMQNFKNLERQNYIQTISSGAGFAASNCGLTAVAILFVMGESSAILPMALGCIFGTGVSIFVVGKLYDSPIFPAEEAWAPGIATAEVLEAGDEGGSKAKRVIQGIVAGAVGTHFGIPVGAIGITFITSISSMAALSIGLVIRGYSPQLTGFDLGTTYIPQGFMIGAGAIALIQSILGIVRSSQKNHADTQQHKNTTVTDSAARATIVMAFGLHLAGAILVGAITGIFSDMGASLLIGWIIWTAFASVASMMLVGMAAMYSGWFPAFAITTIFMTIGVVLGFPPLAVAVLTGYISSVGPCFADMGYDLKTGWIIRGRGEDREHEIFGRKEQVKIEIYGAVLGIIIVMLFANMTLNQGLIPASSTTFAKTCQAIANPNLIKTLLLWAIPGAIIQILGGKHMIGVLFATGLVIKSPLYGVGVLATIVIRLIFKKKGDDFMNCRDAGLIAGDGLYGFFSSLLKMLA